MSQLIDLVRDVFAPDGLLSRTLTHHTFNSDQADYAYRVAQTLEDNDLNTSLSLLEADTGIGKTMGYLVPMMLHAALTKERCAVSTFTLQLQNQLLKKDAVLAASIVHALTGIQLKIAPRKGMRNFVSQAKVSAFFDDHINTACHEDKRLLNLLLRWSGETETGDIREWLENYNELPMGLQSIDICIDADSSEADLQLYHTHVVAAKDADIVIVTHAMLLMHGMYGFKLLSETERPIAHVVADEADRLPIAAESMARRKLSPHMLSSFLTSIVKRNPAKTPNALLELITASEALATCLKSNRPNTESGHFILRETSTTLPQLIDCTEKLHTGLTELNEASLSISGHDLYRLDALRREATQVLSMLKHTLKAQSGDGIAISDYQAMVMMSFSPVFGLPALEVVMLSPGRMSSVYWRKMNAQPFGYLKSCTLTSASLSTPGQTKGLEFMDFMMDLGIYEKYHNVLHKLTYEHEKFGDAEFVFASPDMTGPIFIEDDDLSETEVTVIYDEDWLRNTAKMINEAHNSSRTTGKRTLVLVSSFKDIAMLSEGLYPINKNKLFLHQKGESLNTLLRRFSEEENAVLITPSGWEGLDLPGLLANVVIARIPFSPPDSVYNAILKRYLIEVRNCNDRQANNIIFGKSINSTRRKLRQGIGRGIRQKDDKVTFWFCDPRFPMPDELRNRHFNDLRFKFSRRQYNNLFATIPARFRQGIFAKVLNGKVFDGEKLV